VTAPHDGARHSNPEPSHSLQGAHHSDLGRNVSHPGPNVPDHNGNVSDPGRNDAEHARNIPDRARNVRDLGRNVSERGTNDVFRGTNGADFRASEAEGGGMGAGMLASVAKSQVNAPETRLCVIRARVSGTRRSCGRPQGSGGDWEAGGRGALPGVGGRESGRE